MNGFDDDFWNILDSLVHDSEIIIDRPKGTTHPKYPNFIYKVDYGYLKNTSSMDGAGIDVWVGSGKKQNRSYNRTINTTIDIIIWFLIGVKDTEAM